jgi:phosphate transport system substrate-binding protein
VITARAPGSSARDLERASESGMTCPNDRPRPSGLARLAFAAVLAASALLPVDPAVAQNVTGAGSTFVQPLLNRWSQAYLRSQWTAESQAVGGLDYEAVGSQAGIMRMKDRAVDFGATELPLASEEITRYRLVQFPVAIGGVITAVNLPGVDAGKLKLTGELIADIYLGKVKRWSDPPLKALNPDLALPDADITVVRRSDGSGTTFAFTSFLSKSNTAWRSVGAGLTVNWPLGTSAKGNGGVAEMVRGTPNSIGYVDFATAKRAGLSGPALRNRSGIFVPPSPASFQAAAVEAEWSKSSDFGVSLVDAPGEAAYPIVAVTFVLVPDGKPSSASTAATIAFFDWALESGARAASELDYVPLPASVVDQVRRHWADKLDLQPTSGARAAVSRGARPGL